MKRSMGLLAMLILLPLAGCSEEETVSDSSTKVTSNAETPPTSVSEMKTWLQAGSYQSWSAEGAVHAGRGPHFSRVRVYVNSVMDGALATGATSVPPLSAAIKEMYGPDGDTVRGWAVMVKAKEAEKNGDAWFWYEIYDDNVLAAGDGVGACVDCHAQSRDFFVTTYPLE
jgi:hypothetical protein